METLVATHTEVTVRNSSSSSPSTTTFWKFGKWDCSLFKETIRLFLSDPTSAVQLEWVYTWVESSVIAWKRPGILPVVKMTSSVPLHVQRSLVGVFSQLKNLQIRTHGSNHKEPGQTFQLKRRLWSFKELFQFIQLTVNNYQIAKEINYSVIH